MSDEIEKLKARLFDLEKEKEFVTGRLYFLVGKEETERVMDAKIKEAIAKALATGEKVESKP